LILFHNLHTCEILFIYLMLINYTKTMFLLFYYLLASNKTSNLNVFFLLVKVFVILNMRYLFELLKLHSGYH
jgi:hypothetical protein